MRPMAQNALEQRPLLSPLLTLSDSKNDLARGCGLVRRCKSGEVVTRFAPASRMTGEGAGGPAKLYQA